LNEQRRDGIITTMKSLPALVSVIIAAGLSAGCHRPVTDLADHKRTVLISKSALDQAWDETLDVLREHNFEPDRRDHRAGLITTRASISQQWFEFWRADAQGSYQWAESALHSIRRWVEVRFVPKADNYEITVTVHVQRKSQPERQVTTASGALQIYREKLPIYTGERLGTGQGVRWIEIGTDPKLENYLLERIERRLPIDALEANHEPVKNTGPNVRGPAALHELG